MNEPITEHWLKSVGFGWHQLDRQPDKHWLLWIGAAQQDRVTSYDDLGVELAPAWWHNAVGNVVGEEGRWHCWLRGDTSHRYHRFIHVRYLRIRDELIGLVEALTGQPWDPINNINGTMFRQADAARLRAEHDRFDRQLLRGNPKWSEVEKDDSRGRALPEHLEAHEKAKQQGNPE